MSSKSIRSRIPWFIATGMVGIALVLLLVPDTAKRDTPSTSRPGESQVASDPVPIAEVDSLVAATSDWDRKLAAIAAGSPEQGRTAWQAFRRELLSEPADQATAFIEAFLASGVRMPTGNAFVVGKDGTLLAAPDVRTLLLDLLATIAPLEADREARLILTTPDDPDDWAISLRIVSRSVPPEDRFLAEKVQQHLRVDAWLTQPSIGYLQAYDAAVYVDAPEATHRLLEIADSAYPQATRFAARLALERKAETQFAAAGPLIAAPDALAGEPELRASLMARADVRSQDQRETLEHYLMTLPAFEDEAIAFARWFPNYNQQVSDNLITTDRLTPIEDRMAQDRATLAWIRQVREQPGIAETQAILDTIETRLNRYLAETTEAGNGT